MKTIAILLLIALAISVGVAVAQGLNSEDALWECPDCGKVFDTELGLEVHRARWCKLSIKALEELSAGAVREASAELRQKGTPKMIMISQWIFGVISALALLLAAASGWGIAQQKLRGHIANTEIHKTIGELDDRFPLRKDITTLKEDMNRQFDEVKEAIQHIKEP